MAKEIFDFKAASVGGERNRIGIEVGGDKLLNQEDIEHNLREGQRLAGQLALWLTPVTTRAIKAELEKMGY